MKTRSASYFGCNYMQQFFQLVERLHADALVISWNPGEMYRANEGSIAFVNRPQPQASGLWWHLSTMAWQIWALLEIARYRPDVAVLTGNHLHWWLLAPLRLLNVRLIASYHCVLHHQFVPPSTSVRVLLALNRALVLPKMSAIVTTAPAIRRQVEKALGKKAGSVTLIDHLPTYPRAQFVAIAPPQQAPVTPFTIFFSGRIEPEKGIFDLVEIAACLEAKHSGGFHVHMCGDGSAIGALRESVMRRGLAHVVSVHGYCMPDSMRHWMSRSHIAIVPSRSEIDAGFEMTCAEAILSGRPLITSPVCPAIDCLRPATIEVAPDDVEGYVAAILAMRDDPILYEAKFAACTSLQVQFYDERNSWLAAMLQALKSDGQARQRVEASPINSVAAPSALAPAQTPPRT